MQITATITEVLPLEEGVSKTGNSWRKQTYVGVYDNSNERFPKGIVFSMINEKVDRIRLQKNTKYELSIDFETHEWNGKYYMSASCWAAKKIEDDLAHAAAPATTAPATPAASPVADDDIPF